jgi:hypothetical protein
MNTRQDFIRSADVIYAIAEKLEAFAREPSEVDPGFLQWTIDQAKTVGGSLYSIANALPSKPPIAERSTDPERFANRVNVLPLPNSR